MRDEAPHVERVIEAVRAQRRPPDRWLLVDDGSSDGTGEIAERAAEGVDWIEVRRAPQAAPGGADRLAEAAEARAFLWALGELGDDPWTLLGKLDADMVLAPEHYERLLAEFEADERLGVAGCFYEEERGGRRVVARMPAFHVNGALKVWRRACFEQIGGIAPRLAWDTIDETYARLHGWRTHSFDEWRALHLKPAGSAGGQLRGRARHGECVWILHYPVPTVVARTARLALARPPLVGGLAYLWGWMRAAVTRLPRVEDPAFRAFVRREQWARVRSALR